MELAGPSFLVPFTVVSQIMGVSLEGAPDFAQALNLYPGREKKYLNWRAIQDLNEDKTIKEANTLKLTAREWYSKVDWAGDALEMVPLVRNFIPAGRKFIDILVLVVELAVRVIKAFHAFGEFGADRTKVEDLLALSRPPPADTQALCDDEIPEEPRKRGWLQNVTEYFCPPQFHGSVVSALYQVGELGSIFLKGGEDLNNLLMSFYHVYKIFDGSETTLDHAIGRIGINISFLSRHLKHVVGGAAKYVTGSAEMMRQIGCKFDLTSNWFKGALAKELRRKRLEEEDDAPGSTRKIRYREI